MARDPNWIRRKAQAYFDGWLATFDVGASVQNCALGLSVAIHETIAGDAWPGENNWGAVQKRVPNAEEKAAIAGAGIVPHPSNVTKARAALKAAIDNGTLVDNLANCGLHVDSSPGKGWYWVFFWSYDTDAEGAALFVRVLAKQRASCRAILESAGGSPEQLARAMYQSRYFEGFRKPQSWYSKTSAGKWTEVAQGTAGAVIGSELNIGDYGGACRRIYNETAAALVGWTPLLTAPPSPPVELPPLVPTKKLRRTIRRGDQDLRLGGSDVRDLQTEVGAEPDGRFGPKTQSALMAYQAMHGLDPDGVCGPLTWAVVDR